jgi:hypothetical protein
MQIGEVNEPMRRRGIANPQPANFQPLRLKPFGVGHDGQRRGQQHRRDESAAGHFDFHPAHEGFGHWPDGFDSTFASQRMINPNCVHGQLFACTRANSWSITHNQYEAGV